MRGNKHLAKLRYDAISRGNVDKIKLFNRDGWECQECGCRTPKELMGKNHPCAPTIDHIVPISYGGEHTYDNTRLLCRGCNTSKSNK